MHAWDEERTRVTLTLPLLYGGLMLLGHAPNLNWNTIKVLRAGRTPTLLLIQTENVVLLRSVKESGRAIHEYRYLLSCNDNRGEIAV